MILAEPIAIVGASCRFPGAPDPVSYWSLLGSGRDAIGSIGPDRWATAAFRHPRRGEAGFTDTFAAGVLDDVQSWDAEFFGLSPREASQMDPQQLLLLELAWEALEDAGIPPSRLAGSGTAVFVGASAQDAIHAMLGDMAGVGPYAMTGTALSILANRLSWAFDLKGESLTIDTACSSSLIALHQACAALASGRAEAALVGGVNLLLSPFPFIGFARAGMISPTGRCRPFSAEANGYVRAEGGAVLVLKPLSAALRAGDPIRAVIHASAANADGRTNGLALPDPAVQGALLRRLYRPDGILPERLGYLEAHGTGTPVGDPAEASAIGHAVGRARQAPLPIGSAKGHVGHLEPAAGMAGLIKAVLALEHRLVPPTLGAETPNPAIPFDELNLRPAAAPVPLAEDALIGVSSFGFGGANAHATLGPAPAKPPEAKRGESRLPLLVSARSEAALRDLLAAWRERLEAAGSEEDLAPLLRAAARARDHHPHRAVVLAAPAAEMGATIARHLEAPPAPGVVTGRAPPRKGAIAFVFAGNGTQWPGMGRDAFAGDPAFRHAVEEVDALFRARAGWSVAAAMAEGVAEERLARAEIAQPLLFALQVGLVAALAERGVVPDVVLGHSVGEVAAAFASGALPLAQAVAVIHARSSAQTALHGSGRMAALGLAEEEARAALAEAAGDLAIAAVNAPGHVTVAGPAESLAALANLAEARGWLMRDLGLDYAYHSPAMEPARAPLLAALADLEPRAAARPFVSSVTAGMVPGERLDAAYWWRNVREPVRFADAVRALAGGGLGLAVEIGPQPALQAYLRETLRAAGAEAAVTFTLARGAGQTLPEVAAARCHVFGADLARAAAFDGPVSPRALPRYPWQRRRYRQEMTAEALRLTDPISDHPLLGWRREAEPREWLRAIDLALLPAFADHRVGGAALFPAASFAELALAATRAALPEAGDVVVSDLDIRRPLALEAERTRVLRTRVSAAERTVEIASRQRLVEEPWTVHAVARIGRLPALAAERLPPMPAPSVTAETIYGRAARLGLEYGPAFRSVRAVARLDEATVDCALAPPAALLDGAEDALLLPPALLDGAFHALLAAEEESEAEGADTTLLPVRFGRIRLLGDGRSARRARVRITARGQRTLTAEIRLADESGRLVALVEGCVLQAASLPGRGRALADSVWRFVPFPSLAGADRETAPTALAAALAALEPPAAPRRRHAEAALLAEAFVHAAAHAALTRLFPDRRPIVPDLLVREGRLSAAALPLLERLVSSLAEIGAAEAGADGWRLVADAGLPPPVEIWRSALAQAPDFVSELAAAARAAAELEDVLRAGPPGRPAGPAILEHLRSSAPLVAAPAVAEAARALGAVLAAWPKERPLRVLEVAAGGGALLRAVQPLAEAASVHLAWTLSDPDPAVVQSAASRLGARPGRRFAAFDPATAAPDALAGPFDLVVGTGLAALSLVGPDAMPALVARLAEGGAVLFAVPAPSRLVDLVFGRDPAWLTGPAERLSAGAAYWHEALARAGLVDVSVLAAAEGAVPGGVLLAVARRQEPRAAAAPGRGILLLAEPETGASALASRASAELARAGRRVTVCAPGTDWRIEEGGDVVLLGDPADAADPATAATARTALAVQAARRAAAACARLWLVTAGAVQPDDGDAHDPAEAAVWGLGRVIRNESPALEVRLLDLAPKLRPGAMARALAEELAAPDDETEVVRTAEGRRVLRLVRSEATGRQDAGGGARVLAVRRPGALETLTWTHRARRRPGPGEVEITVAAAGLNFRDVMWAQGLLPEHLLADGFAGPSLGMECAGTVAAVGPDVAGLKPGDRVMAFAPSAFASHAITLAAACLHLPQSLSFAEAATMPVAFLTALHALDDCARLAPGETVLIHGGAGGVGLAALQIAKARGARVIATAGSEEKRALLRLLGADAVCDSRGLGFVDGVRATTGGEGVDVVLNSLAGEALEASLALLRPFGRFVELGKRDFALGTRVALRPLARNAAFFGVDLDSTMRADPARAVRLFAELGRLAARGSIRPLPYRLLQGREVRDAFRLMQASGHIGKIVLTPPSSDPQRRPASSAPAIRADRTYVVTGGLSGLGLEVARWLSGAGARHLALLSRRGATPEAEPVLAELAASGVSVRAWACNVADRAALEATLAAVRREQAPIGGVVHAAAVLADATLARLAEEDLAAAIAPKVGGAWNLHLATGDDPVELFVLFSSATTAIGNPGQGAYVAANHALEALARARRAAGLPAVAIGWGPIGGTGMLARAPEVATLLEKRLGLRPIPVREAIAALPALLASPHSVLHVADLDGAQARARLPILATPTFAEARLPGDGAQAVEDGEDLRLRLAELPEAEARALLEATLAAEAAKVLGLAPQAVECSRPLADLGMDSLMAVEFGLAVENRFGGSLPAVTVAGGVSIAELAARLLPPLRGHGAAAASVIALPERSGASAAKPSLRAGD